MRVAEAGIDHYPRGAMNDAALLHWIAERLIRTYGAPVVSLDDPVETLVLTILSQNTTDANRDRAFAALLERFGTLRAVAAATIAEIEPVIRPGGLQQQKAKSIHGALARILDERGALDLSFLAGLSRNEALAWLLDIPGVGPKTAGIVLLFAFGRPVFPADTHVRRVMHRMGLVPARGDPHPRLNALLPPDAEFMQRLHLLAIRLGREICHPRSPECPRCPLRSRCRWLGRDGSHAPNAVTSGPTKEASNHGSGNTRR